MSLRGFLYVTHMEVVLPAVAPPLARAGSGANDVHAPAPTAATAASTSRREVTSRTGWFPIFPPDGNRYALLLAASSTTCVAAVGKKPFMAICLPQGCFAARLSSFRRHSDEPRGFEVVCVWSGQTAGDEMHNLYYNLEG